MMMEGVRPELDGELSANEEGTNGIGDSQMSTFNRSILIGSVGTSRTNLKTMATKKGSNLRIVVEFTALIQVDIFSRALVSMIL